MSERMDPLARLRAANPVAAEDAPSADSPQAVAMFERIVATPPDSAPPATVHRFRRSLRRGMWVLIPAAVLAGAVGYARTHNPQPAAGVVCWAQASMSDGVDRGDADLRAPDVIAACAFHWGPKGDFGPTSPHLTACVGDTSVIDVFPDEYPPDTCGHLGLDPYTGGGDLQADPAVRFEIELSEQLAICHSSDAAKELARDLLASLHLDWQIIVSLREDEPCAAPAFHAEIGTVILVGG
jgi:hypothetical protein